MCSLPLLKPIVPETIETHTHIIYKHPKGQPHKMKMVSSRTWEKGVTMPKKKAVKLQISSNVKERQYDE